MDYKSPVLFFFFLFRPLEYYKNAPEPNIYFLCSVEECTEVTSYDLADYHLAHLHSSAEHKQQIPGFPVLSNLETLSNRILNFFIFLLIQQNSSALTTEFKPAMI